MSPQVKQQQELPESGREKSASNVMGLAQVPGHGDRRQTEAHAGQGAHDSAS